MRRVSRRSVLTGTLGALAAPSIGRARFPQDVPEGLVFFVGNSFTRQHDVPSLVCRIAEYGGVTMHCHRHTANGAHLIDSISFARQILAERDTPIPATVVLQDHSTVALSAKARRQSAEAMAAYAAGFSKTVLFETWPRRDGHSFYRRDNLVPDAQAMARATEDHYAEQATHLGAVRAQIARAWLAASQRGIDLYAQDGYHANLTGAWVTAMLLAKALSLPDPFGAPPPEGLDGADAVSIATQTAQTP